MKVAIITNTLHEEIVPLAKHLSKLVNIDLFSTISSDKVRGEIFFEKDTLWKRENYGIIKNIDKKKYISEIFLKYINNSFGNHAFLFKSMKFYSLKNLPLIYNVAQFLKREKYDLIHFNGSGLFFYLLRIFLRKIPFILVTHDPNLHSGEPRRRAELLRKLLRTQKSIQHIVHSESSKNDLLRIIPKLPKENISIAGFGLHEWMPYQNREVPIKKNSILFFGRICPYKGIEYLIEAAKIARKETNDLHVIIAGSGDFHFDISDVITDNTFTIINRYVTNEELTYLIKQSEFVVCPYNDATQSGVVMTAHTFNKPVIASNVGGFSEYIEDGITGVIVPPRDPINLAKAISTLLSNPKILIKMRRNIKEKYLSGEFSWNNMAKKTLDIYKQVINKKS